MAAEAEEIKRTHSAACAACPYTVDDCHTCRYNGKEFHDLRYRNEFLTCIPSCPKYEAYIAKKRMNRILAQSNMGARFKGRTFETFRATKETQEAYNAAIRFCHDYEAGNPRGLMLCGGYGTGKTHLAAAIVQRLAENGIVTLFLSVPELFARLRASIDNKTINAEEIVTEAMNAPVLVLDDLGAEKTSQWTQEHLYRIINHRYEHLLPIVITTNCTGCSLVRSVGERNLSRLAEITGAPVMIQASDWRMKEVG